nr:hypothetical protein [Tanacetum cinerariifolium]
PIFEESKNSFSDNSSPEFKTFCDHTEETRSELLIDDSIPSLVKEESDFDNPSFPRPPSEPPDAEFDVETDAGEEISVMMNDELECLDPTDEIDASTNDEDDDYFPFMFVIRIFLPDLIYS